MSDRLSPRLSADTAERRGPDGLTDLSLTAATGRDDVVVGNDGGYFGTAAKY